MKGITKMYKYLLIKKTGDDIVITYEDLPMCVDQRLSEEEVIEMLLDYCRDSKSIIKQLEGKEDNTFYAVLKGGDTYDASKYVQIVIDNELY